MKAAVDRRLFAGGGAPVGQRAPAAPGLLSSLGFWRGLAVAALAALALYVALPFISPPPVETPQERLVASLAADGSDVRYLAVYDERTNDIGLSRVAGEPAQGSDFELWVIEGQQAPVSLGVIPAGASARLPVTDALRAKMVSGALFAISVEPAGGSTTGAPTGPVVAAGDLEGDLKQRVRCRLRCLYRTRTAKSQAFMIDFQRASRSMINSARRLSSCPSRMFRSSGSARK